ncbi:hypothetical protein A4X09_0g7803, partial [Tilletia walkeri]
MLSDTTSTRGGSGLVLLYEECMYYANSGSVRQVTGKASVKRLALNACVDLIHIHAEAFRILWPFSPSTDGIPVSALQALAAQWGSSVETQIQEHLMPSLAGIINKVSDIKMARQYLHDMTTTLAAPLVFPSALWLIAKHYQLDAAALSYLSDSIQYKAWQSEVQARAEYGKSKEQLKAEAWEIVFDMSKPPFHSTNRRTLDAYIKTDGVAISVHKKRNEKQRSKSQVKSRRYKSSRGAARRARARGKALKLRAAFPEIETLTEDEIQKAVERAVFIDPGERNILDAVGEHSFL